MYYFHEHIFMPRFNFNEHFWKNIEILIPSHHAIQRSNTREFPFLSLDDVRSRGHIYEVGFDKNEGIVCVTIGIPMGDGRDLFYVISCGGLIITGWFESSSDYYFPAESRNYVSRSEIS